MDKNKSTVVGVVSFILILLIGSLILWKSDIRFRANGYKLICSFSHVGGLTKGSEVRYRGYSVGRVSTVIPEPSDIKVEIWVKRDVPITQGSTVRVLFDGLVGENYVAIEPNENETKLMAHGDIIYGSSGSDLAEFIDLGSQNMVHAEAILYSLRELLTNKQTLLNLQHFIRDASGLTSELLTFTKELNKHADFEKISTIINELYDTSTLVKKSSIDLLGDGKIVDDLRTFSTQLSLMSQILNQTSENLNSAVDEETILLFKDSVKNINEITKSLNGLLNSSSSSEEKKSPFKLGGVFDVLTSVEFDTDAEFRYGAADNRSIYEANLDMKSGKYFIRTGIGDQTGESKLQNIQHGIVHNDKLTSRIGYFYDTPGLGVDYKFTPKMGVSLSAYDIGHTKLMILGDYNITEEIELLYGLRNNLDNNQLNTIDMGTRVKF